MRGTTSYTLTAAKAKGVHIWYGGTTSSTFTLTLPAISDVISTVTSSNGDPEETFEVYVGRRVAGDITISATDTIDILGDGSSSYSATQTVRTGQWIKIVGWYSSSSTQRYLMSGSSQPYDAGLQSISALTTGADKMIYTTGSDTYAVTDLTSAGRALLDDADASAQRTTLGLGTASTAASTDFLSGTGADTLGGDLDVGTSDIISSSNNPIELAPDGSGVVTIKGNATGGSGQLKLNCEQNSHGVTIKGPPHSAAASYTLTLPDDDGDAGEVLQSDGSGNLSWVAQSGGGGGSAPTVTTVTQSSSPYPSSGVLSSTGNEQIFIINPDTVNVVVNLPSAATAGSGFKYQIKNTNSTYNLVLTPASGTIDSSNTHVISVQNESITLVSDGSNYFII